MAKHGPGEHPFRKKQEGRDEEATEEAEAKMKAVIGLGQTPTGASTAATSQELPQLVVRAQDLQPGELTTRMMTEMGGMGLTPDMAKQMAVFFSNTLNAKAVLTPPQPSSSAAGSGGTPVQALSLIPI